MNCFSLLQFLEEKKNGKKQQLNNLHLINLFLKNVQPTNTFSFKITFSSLVEKYI